jgi:mannose-6-phosphate isomerase-like protein (cupin superfamily)
MQAWMIADLMAQQAQRNEPYFEFLRVPLLSVGVYTLAVGARDEQQPHSEDEVYYVVAGRAMLSVGDDERAVAPGDLVYVAAHVPHRFHTITEDLTTLVFFAPAEYSLATGQPQQA